MAPKLVVLYSRKMLQVLFFEKKKNPSSLFAQIRFSKRCAQIFFKKNQFRDTLTFGDLTVSKRLFFTVKLSAKCKRQKIKKIPTTVLETMVS